MPAEKIRIWHPYRADVLAKGQRRPSRVVLRAPIDLEVASVTNAEVPLVGRIVAGTATWAKSGRGEGQRVEYRGWNGILWGPVGRGAQYGQTDVVGWNRIATGTNRWPPFLYDPVLTEHEHRTGEHLDWRRISTPEDIEGRIVEDDRTVAAAAARSLEQKLLLVDGKVWRRKLPPAWSVEQLGLGCYCVYLDAPSGGRHPYRGNAETAFGIDRLDDMLAWCAEIGRRRHRDPETFGPAGSVLEFDPAYLRRNDLALETARLGEQALRVFEDRIGNMTLPGIDAYGLARAAHARVASDGTHADVVAFLEAVEDMASDLRRFDYPGKAAASRDEALKLLDVLDRRIRGYEAAALAEAYAPPPGLVPPSPSP